MVMPVTLQVSVVSTEFVFIQLYYTVPNTAMSILQCYSDCCILIIFMLILCRYFPFGIVFLIAGKILEMEDPSVIGQKLGLYVITVVSGLILHGLILLPLLFVLITKKNPFAFIQGILQALLIALATSSR